MSVGSVKSVQWQEFHEIATKSGVTLPVEQSSVWDSFDRVMPGREPWGRLLYCDSAGRPRALIALTRFTVKGFPYLWAKHGPVWLGEDPDASEEADMRVALIKMLRARDSSIVFVRMHALHRAKDCRELLQTKAYDRTVILNLDYPDDDALLASFKSRGRRDVRKALRDEHMTFADETDRVDEVFDELYQLLTQTGERDGFRAAPQQTYVNMLKAMGPKNCRLYVARYEGREALAWSIEALWEDGAAHYYAASSAQGRKLQAPDALLYKAACWLRADGVRTFDLMGVDSERAPELAGVRGFKTKFSAEDPVEVAGAWDVTVRPMVYELLVRALSAKRGIAGLVGRIRACFDTRVE